MNLVRNILFSISLIIIIGHDIVPHGEAVHAIEFSDTIRSEAQDDHSHSVLGHIFEHFQHSPNDRNLTYLAGAEKVIKTAIKIIANDFLYSELENRELWYTNREKQRFWDYLVTPYSVSLHSYSLRGPPIC
ncbi:hypothetical protein [Yeosuana sp.]|uniref:hypothetical protein n=1 Tax=Yeosuana sp. TaxID=2529388 RepID=UPI004054DD76